MVLGFEEPPADSPGVVASWWSPCRCSSCAGSFEVLATTTGSLVHGISVLRHSTIRLGNFVSQVGHRLFCRHACLKKGALSWIRSNPAFPDPCEMAAHLPWYSPVYSMDVFLRLDCVSILLSSFAKSRVWGGEAFISHTNLLHSSPRRGTWEAAHDLTRI